MNEAIYPSVKNQRKEKPTCSKENTAVQKIAKKMESMFTPIYINIENANDRDRREKKTNETGEQGTQTTQRT